MVFSIFDSKVEVFDENDKPVGIFRRQLFSIGGKFDVLDMQGDVACHAARKMDQLGSFALTQRGQRASASDQKMDWFRQRVIYVR